ncbi:hypothetical protein CEE45_15240 [Candidatus Heimdallarchaeota archaeon B3_Heim]|nr:MAG: hypothetical protein CEE45_15240 [Candidatus Heimdallarchaeota archaeon B3_Heim]
MNATLKRLVETIHLHVVPSDLLEYPVINYFQYRNNGYLEDFQLTNNLIQKYLPYHKKDPRLLFTLDPQIESNIIWNDCVERGMFCESIGSAHSPYRPKSDAIFCDPKFDPLKQLIVHRYIRKNVTKDHKNAFLFIHGYAESHFIFHEQFYFRLAYNQFKIDIYALELPYHHHRVPYDSPFSGAYFLNGNPIRMLEAFNQSISEIQFLVNYLKKRYDRVILFGVSLGGHLVAVSSQLVTDIDCIAALASPFLFGLSLKTNIVPIANNYILQHKEQGLASTYTILYSTNLKYFYPYTTNENTTIIGGIYDRIVPFNLVAKLAKMLQKPLYRYPGGHLTLLAWFRSLITQINRQFSSKK